MAGTKSQKSKCPICGDATDAQYRPFCSKRCADVDLGRWLGGGYAIAGRDDDDDAAMATGGGNDGNGAGDHGLNGNRGGDASNGDS